MIRSLLLRARVLGLVAVLLLAVWFLNGCLIRPNKSQTTLKYNLPTKLTLRAGEALPGSSIQYERMDEEGAYLLIDDQQALKRKGDSLDWEGSPVEDVLVDLDLRIAWFTEEALHMVGVADVVVDDVNPRPAQPQTSSPITYSGPVLYNLARGATVPGTTIVYESETEDGVRLGGLEGYPYRRAGDSIFWEGMLNDHVSIRLDLRVVQYSERALRLGGVVTLWIGS